MAPRNSSLLVTPRLRLFNQQIRENIENYDYAFLDEERATVHEINVLYRSFNKLRDLHEFEDDVMTHILDGLVRAKAMAAARHAATRRARTRRSSRSRSNSRSRSRPRTPVSTQGGKRRTRKH